MSSIDNAFSFQQFGGASFGTSFDAPSGCRCGRQCVCPPGRPCRCGSTCACSGAGRPAGRTDLWREAGESEFAARSGMRRPAASPFAMQPAAGAFQGLTARQRWLRHQAGAPYQQPGAQDPWMRRRGLNHYFAQRFGWGRHVRRIAALIGCPACPPGSRQFVSALARWQRRQGLQPTGVLTPRLWWTMRRWLANTGAPPAYASQDDTAGMAAAAPQAGAEPPGLGGFGPGDAPPDTPAEPPPSADHPAQEFGAGFRGRRQPYRPDGF